MENLLDAMVDSRTAGELVSGTRLHPYRILFSLLTFLTTWNLLAVLFSAYLHPYVDLLLSSTVVLFVSTYFMFVRPGYFALPLHSGGEIVVDPRDPSTLVVCVTIHFLIHFAPWAYVLYAYGEYYRSRGMGWHTLVTVSVMMFYAIVVDVERKYRTAWDNVTIQVSVIVLLYTFFNYKKA
jgi:hypothetical protein